MGSLAEALEVLVTDGRRPANQVSLEQVQGYWSRAFCKVPSEVLHKAVEKWLEVNKRGWPRVAELLELIEVAAPSKPKEEILSARHEAQKRHEIRWTISILEDPGRYEGEDYKHTLETAEYYLRRYGYSSWQDAKAWLEPGWAPAQVTEVYL